MTIGPSTLLVSIPITEWTLIALSTVVIIARVYLRLVIQKRKLLDSDMWMIAAWLAGICVASFCVTYVHMGVMEPWVDLSLEEYDGSREDKEFILMLLWVCALPFFTAFYLCKAALLAVYRQVIPVFMHKRRMFLWVTVVYVVLSYIVTMVLPFCVCIPVTRFWSLEPDEQCPHDAAATYLKTSWALHFVGDVFIFVLPWLIVPDLMIKGWLRVGVYLTFLLGIINMVISIIRFHELILIGAKKKTSIVEAHFWNTLDLYLGLVIACLPSLRPYFNLAANSRAFNSIRGKGTNSSSRYTTDSIQKPEKARIAQDQSGISPVRPVRQLSQSSREFDLEACRDSSETYDEAKNKALEIELARVRTRAREASDLDGKELMIKGNKLA
ncbi:integral membrane protein [Fusarium beomiforme]|uniref:Integral membrane protein n=1 Tax=Fusarium beomiforme TaxID=44412 RepID=A0A9P5AMQ1_9HYPO|nr:integral membrane protein [Fusarium beomiforme]